MWPFPKPEESRKPKYPSFRAWMHARGVPQGWLVHPDKKKVDVWIEEYGILKKQLWNAHILTLSELEQDEFRTGIHPSLSHSRADRAAAIVPSMRQHLLSRGINADIKIGFYHMDRIVLSAYIDADPETLGDSLPWLYRGYEVFYIQKENEN
jgi:hypothetical protein